MKAAFLTKVDNSEFIAFLMPYNFELHKKSCLLSNIGRKRPRTLCGLDFLSNGCQINTPMQLHSPHRGIKIKGKQTKTLQFFLHFPLHTALGY